MKQVPIASIYADMETEEVTMTFTNNFYAMSFDEQASIATSIQALANDEVIGVFEVEIERMASLARQEEGAAA
jgi:hypothetical protein